MKTEKQIREQIQELESCERHYRSMRIIYEQIQVIERTKSNPQEIEGSCDIDIDKSLSNLQEYCSYITERCEKFVYVYKDLLENE